MQYNIFGSSSSQDYDIMVSVPQVPENKELCKVLCQAYEAILKDYLLDKEININICEISTDENKDRFISKVFKGTADECNNSVLSTYLRHKQYCDILVSKLVDRDVNLKLARACRIILTLLSHTPFRANIKTALQSKNFAVQYTLLRNFDFNIVNEQFLEKKGLSLYDFRKKVAFQFCQTMALIDGNEIYDKLECFHYYNVPIWSLDIDLNELRDLFVKTIDEADLDWDLIKE